MASGWSPIYPLPRAGARMRQHPVGNWPVQIRRVKPNERITVTRNPDYWKPGVPTSTHRLHDMRSGTRNLAFSPG